MRFSEIENRSWQPNKENVKTIIDIARKHQGYVTTSQIEGVYSGDPKNQKKLYNYLRTKHRINVVNDLDDVLKTDSKVDSLSDEEKKVFNYFTDPKRKNINNDVVKALLADALSTKKISGANWMTLTNNIRSSDGDTARGAEWNVGRKLGRLGVSIDQSLTIDQKKTAVQPSDKPVTVPAQIQGADAKAFEKIVSKTNINKRKMISDILTKAFEDKQEKLGSQKHRPGDTLVTLSPKETNKLIVNTAMREADIGRTLGPLGIALSL